VPTRKQRRRRQKGRRHEYEYVYVDDEGRELEPDEVEDVAIRNGGSAKQKQRQPARGAARRAIEPPSWRRVLKRGLFVAPLMYLLVVVLPGTRDLTLAQQIQQTIFLLVIFLPFSYVMDSITYRLFVKRQAALENRPPAEKK